MKNHIAGFAIGIFAVIGVLIACTPQTQSSPIPSSTVPIPATAESLTPTPDEIAGKFDIGGRSLYLRCVGAGTPTAILETGWTGPGYHWSDVMNQARQITRLCAYDRAGLGQSDPAPPPRTSRDMVADLHALLDVAKIQGPYILVGQSFGGFIVRMYANQYPEEIIGIVLVDSTHPDQDAAYSAALPPEAPDESPCVNQFRTELAEVLDPLEMPEGLDWAGSAAEVRDLGSLGDLPLAVITAGWSVCGGPIAPDDAAGLDQAWQDLQKELAGLSSRSVHIIAEDSSHNIHWDQPAAVIEGIQAVIEMAKEP